MTHISLRTGIAVFIVAAALSGCADVRYNDNVQYNDNNFHQPDAEQPRVAQERTLPSLIVTDDPPPGVIYRRGSHDTVLANTDAGTVVRITPLSAQRMETPVTLKAEELSRDLAEAQKNTDKFTRRFQALQDNSDAQMDSYYALVASIHADLQTGTTLGNPILVDRWNNAQDKLNALSQGTGLMNTLSMDLSDQASKASFLLESTRAAFALSGAVDEDHRRLRIVEDKVNQNVTATAHLINLASDALNRRTAYLRTERANLQALSMAIANGELHGQSLSNSVFKNAVEGRTGKIISAPGFAASRRPLVIIRFDRPNVSYDQPLYTAISQALEKYPSAKFDLVAVSSSKGNPAQMAVASSEARKNGEAVLRSLTKMGLPMERINLNAANSREVLNSEVQLYIR